MTDAIQHLISEAGKHREDMVLNIRKTEARRRREAIASMESFVSRYERYKNDPQYREHIADTLFRLGELYRDHAEYRMEMDSRLYDQRMKEYDWGIRPSPPNDAEADYGKSLEMYRKVVDGFRDYRYRDMVMYLMGYYLRLQEDLAGSAKVLRGMVTDYPESRYAMAAWMLIGHTSYDLSDYKNAIEAYSVVASKKQDNEAYEDALYRLGWSCFEEFKYERAIAAFLALLDYGEESKGKMKQRLALRKEAIESIANSFVDADWDGDDLPDVDYGPERAMRYVSAGKPYEKEILRMYGDLLFDLRDAQHYRHAVGAYTEYLQRDALDQENPLVHDRIVYCYFELSRSATLTPQERQFYADQAMAERKRMVELYGKDSKWAETHRYNAKALTLAATKLSMNLLERAQLLHQHAQDVKEELGAEAAQPHYENAGGAYRDFLNQFPGHAQYVDMLRRYADIEMFGLNHFARAAEVFSELRGLDRKDNPYRLEAAEMILEARAKLVLAAQEANDPAVQIPEKLFDKGIGTTIAKIEVSDTKDPTAKRKVTPVEIPAVVEDWMAEVRKYIDLDLAGASDKEYKGTLAYQIGKIYLRYGHFDKAREQLEAVLKEFGSHPLLSVYCYTDLARTYRYENDLDNLEVVSNRMKEEGKGDPDSVNEILSGIKDARLKARFQRAGALLESAQEAQGGGDEPKARELYTKAANELETIVDENPEFDQADVALIEAARAFQQVKLYEKAAKLYKRLVEEPRFTESEHRELAVMNLAENYEKFFNFSGAVKTYLRITSEYQGSKNVKPALLKAAILYENDQNYLKAAAIIQDFVKRYAKDPNVGKLEYSLINMFEKGGDTEAARSASERFVKRHGRKGELVNQTMTATIKLGRWAEDSRSKREAQRRFKEVVKMYEDNGLKPATRPAHLAAESSFRLAESRFDEYAAVQLKGRSAQQRKLGIKKRDKLLELEAIYGTIANYESPQWTVAAYFKVGALWKDLSDAFANAPYPSDLPQDEDFRFQYEIQIGDLKGKFEDKARTIWREGVEIAKQTGVNNEWTRKILVELNRYEEDRQKYPLFREIRQFGSEEPLRHYKFAE